MMDVVVTHGTSNGPPKHNNFNNSVNERGPDIGSDGYGNARGIDEVIYSLF